MYSESDLDAAVAAGVLSPEAAAAFRAHVAGGRGTPVVDEEHFRLLTGFNDIFVAIASVLVLVAVGWLGAELTGMDRREIPSPLPGVLVAATAWGLAEYFTKARRMALPSILLLLAFAGGVAFACMMIGANIVGDDPSEAQVATIAAIAGAATAGATWLHWRRFRVPITVAAGAAAVVAIVVGAIGAISHIFLEEYGLTVLFIAGLGVFAYAMRWDMSDTERKTRRSDVAFWLHLLAAPMIVHPIFSELGGLEGTITMGAALLVVGLYIVLALVALAIDRRALMVSALAYVLYALSELFRELGAVGLNVALTALVIGSALLLLSAFWHTARGVVVGFLPEGLQRKLPATQRSGQLQAA